MTRDEILNMPAGREMDALIAEKVLGWTVDDLTATSPSGSSNSRIVHGDDDWLKYYSTDIAAAWEVVESHPHYVSLVRSNETGWRPAPWGEMLWHCRFYAPEKFLATADTAPLAICRAALLAVIDKVSV